MTALVTCACPEKCEIHPVNRGRRFFLMGALALPVARKLELPALPTAALLAPAGVTLDRLILQYGHVTMIVQPAADFYSRGFAWYLAT